MEITAGEWFILIIIVVLVILAIIIVLSLNHDGQNKRNINTTIIRPPLSFQPKVTTNSSTTPNVIPSTTSPQIFISTPTSTPNQSNNVQSSTNSDIGSICSKNSDCRTENCSNGFCQGHNIVTGLTDAFCIPSSTPGCSSRYSCQNGKCTPIGNDLFESCDTINDCKPSFVCSTPPFGQEGGKVCQYQFDSNMCVGSTCSGGHQCSGNRCIGQSGVPCRIDSECVNGCGTQSIIRWIDNKWSRYAAMPTNVKFDRMIAINRLNGDDIWGLDLNNGLYYWKHDNPAQTWIKVLDNTFQRNTFQRNINNDLNNDSNNSSTDKLNMTLIDMAVVHAEAVYLVYRAVSSTSDNYSHTYPIYRLNMFRATNPKSTPREKLVPFGTDDGIQYTGDGETFAEIIGMDAIMDNGRTCMSIYGRCHDDNKYYTFSQTGDDLYFEYSGPNHGSGMGPNNLIRLVRDLTSNSRYDYDKRHNTYRETRDYGSDQGRLYNYLEFGHDMRGQRTSSLAINGGDRDGNLPNSDDLLIYDYFPFALKNTVATYIIAQDRKAERTHLYMVPNSADGTIYPLPGYVSAETKVSATKNGVYLYNPGTCI